MNGMSREKTRIDLESKRESRSLLHLHILKISLTFRQDLQIPAGLAPGYYLIRSEFS